MGLGPAQPPALIMRAACVFAVIGVLLPALPLILTDEEPADESSAGRAITRCPRQIPGRWNRTWTFMTIVFRVQPMQLGIFVDRRDPAADILAVYRPATFIENEIGPQDHQ